MKKRYFYYFFTLLIMAVFMTVSCAATPDDLAPAQMMDPVQAPPVTAADPLMEEARTRAQASRQRAIDVQSPAYFPSEWEALEAQYQAANNTAAFNAVAAAFDELFRRTAPLYAQAREDEIMAAREALIATGLTGVYPEYLRLADDTALDALDLFEAGDYSAARDTAARALGIYRDLLCAADIYLVREELVGTGVQHYYPEILQRVDDVAIAALAQFDAGDFDGASETADGLLDRYNDLLLGARIYLVRGEIINRGFIQYDPDNFSRADEMAFAAVDEYQAGNRAAALASAEEVLLRYNVVLSNGWVAFARSRQASAARERDLALSERANIASRETFRDGDTLFNQAQRLFSARNYNDSALTHVEAEALFAISRQETRERRLRAEEAIRLAEETIILSNEAAMEAERIIEGGSR